MVNAALSRKLGQVMNLEPLTRLDAVERLQLGRRVDAAREFVDLSEEDRQLILAAERTRERVISEKQRSAAGQRSAGKKRSA